MDSRTLSRRQFLRISAMTAAGSLAAACVTTVPQVTGQAVEEAGPAPAASGELKTWVFPLTENDQDWLWTPMMETFNKEYPDIKVDIELLPWGGRREKMLTAFAAGQAPDIAYVNTDTISLFGTRDVLVALDDLISKEEWDDYPEAMTQGISWEGKRLMIPTLFIVTGHVANKALLEEIGWDPENPPFTWDDLQQAGDMARKKDYFLTDWNTWSWGDFVNLVWQAGGTCLNEEATESLLDSQPGIDATAFVTDMFKNEWVPREGAVGSAEESDALSMSYFFQNQQLIVNGNPTIIDQVSRQAPDMEIALVETWKGKEQAQNVSSGAWGIFKTTQYQQAATEWIKFMIRPENQGFYCSVTGFSPPRESAVKYWTVDPLMREFVKLHLPFSQINQDTNFHWQLQKVLWAPHLQAAVLDLKSVEDAAQEADAEITAAIQEELEKQKQG